MNKVEILDLLTEIKENYPNFDVSDESIARHYKRLHDFPFAEAMQNVDAHIKTNRFPPLIADIRGNIGDQMDAQRSKQEAESYLSQMDASARCNVPPPMGFWEAGRARIRGEA